MKKVKTKWFSYHTLTTRAHSVRWKIYIHRYMKALKNWKGHKPSEFEFLIDIETGEIKELRNVQLLNKIFTK